MSYSSQIQTYESLHLTPPEDPPCEECGEPGGTLEAAEGDYRQVRLCDECRAASSGEG